MGIHLIVTGMQDLTPTTAAVLIRLRRAEPLVVHAENIDAIMRISLAALKPAGSEAAVECLDIVGHGGPGRLEIGVGAPSEVSCAAPAILALAKLGQIFGGEAPRLRLLGCGTATNGEDPGTDGPVLLSWLAHALRGVRIYGTLCDITAEMFGPAGLILEEEYLASHKFGEQLATSVQRKTHPESLPPVPSPVSRAWMTAMAPILAGVPAGVRGWLLRLAGGQWRDAGGLLATTIGDSDFAIAGERWTVGITSFEKRILLTRNGDGARFMFTETTPQPLVEALLDRA